MPPVVMVLLKRWWMSMYGWLIHDVQHFNEGQPEKHQFFWWRVQDLNNSIDLAADEHQHDTVTHLAIALSVHDLHKQVSWQCPEGTLPSKKWLLFQFWPIVHDSIVTVSPSLHWCTLSISSVQVNMPSRYAKCLWVIRLYFFLFLVSSRVCTHVPWSQPPNIC